MNRRFARTIDLTKIFYVDPVQGVGADGESTGFSTGAVVVALLGGVAVGSIALYYYMRPPQTPALNWGSSSPHDAMLDRHTSGITQKQIDQWQAEAMADRERAERAREAGESRIERQYRLQMQRPEIQQAIWDARDITARQRGDYEPAPITERDDGPAPAPGWF